jgi:hypothetical protein
MAEDQDNESVVYMGRQGSLVLKKPDIVRLNDGTLLLEETCYKCPCGRQTCRIYVSQPTFSQHLTRKRKNMAINRIPFEEYKASDYVRYRYRKLTLEEQQQALVKLNITRDEVRIKQSHRTGEKSRTSPWSIIRIQVDMDMMTCNHTNLRLMSKDWIIALHNLRIPYHSDQEKKNLGCYCSFYRNSIRRRGNR